MVAFSGGVFLAVALLHILPEAVSDFANEIRPEDEPTFPLPYFLVFCGYSLILIIDKVMFDSHALLEGGHDDHVDHSERYTEKTIIDSENTQNDNNIKRTQNISTIEADSPGK